MNYPDKIFCAPMAGVSDKPFREMIRLYQNPPVFTTEMISVESLIYRKTRQNIRLLDLKAEPDLIVQLVGYTPACFVKSAQLAYQAGASQIDINMGCAVKKIISKKAGYLLTQDISKACQIVTAIKQAVPIPVSVKTRLVDNLPDLAHHLQEAGICSLCLHARTPQEGYNALPHWEKGAGLKKKLSIPLIINGNITDLTSLTAALSVSHADYGMIGRASLGTPWLFQEISTGQGNDKNIWDLMNLHLEKMLSFYGIHTGLLTARKHLGWYLKHTQVPADFKKNLLTQKDPAHVQHLILSAKG